VVYVPPQINAKDILQAVKADPRVQSAPGVSVSDESFLRAVIMLADAIARGDASKMEPLLSRRAKETLAMVQASGGLEKSAKEIEAVRVVFAAPPSALSGAELTQALMTWSTEFKRGEKLRESTWARVGFTKEEITRFEAAAAENFGKELAKLGSDGSAEAAIEGKPEFVVLMAVQDPRGSYLLGWSGLRDGGSWLFNNASTVPIERNRASDWDDVGMVGFSIGNGEILPETPANDTAGKPGEKGADGAPSLPTPAAPQDGAPIPRKTPSGPVNIPRPGGAG